MSARGKECQGGLEWLVETNVGVVDPVEREKGGKSQAVTVLEKIN